MKSLEEENMFKNEEFIIKVQDLNDSEKKLRNFLFSTIFLVFSQKKQISRKNQEIHYFTNFLQNFNGKSLILTTKTNEKLTNFSDFLNKISKKMDFLRKSHEKLKKIKISLFMENQNLKKLVKSQKNALKDHIVLYRHNKTLETELYELKNSEFDRKTHILTESTNENFEKNSIIKDLSKEKSSINAQKHKIEEMEQRVTRILQIKQINSMKNDENNENL